MTIKIPGGTYYTVTDATEILDVSPRRLRKMIQDNIITAVTVTERFYLISKKEVDRVKRLHRPAGRPIGSH